MEILQKEFNELIVVFLIKKDREIEKNKSDNDSSKRGSVKKHNTRIDQFLSILFKKVYINNTNQPPRINSKIRRWPYSVKDKLKDDLVAERKMR